MLLRRLYDELFYITVKVIWWWQCETRDCFTFIVMREWFIAFFKIDLWIQFGGHMRSRRINILFYFVSWMAGFFWQCVWCFRYDKRWVIDINIEEPCCMSHATWICEMYFIWLNVFFQWPVLIWLFIVEVNKFFTFYVKVNATFPYQVLILRFNRISGKFTRIQLFFCGLVKHHSVAMATVDGL